MSYTKLTTAADIQAYFKGLGSFSVSTTPTLAQVENWIDEGTSKIYGILEPMYTVPVTNADDLLILKSIANLYVLDVVRQVLGLNPMRQLADGSLIPVQASHKEFYAELDRLRCGVVVLPNTTRKSDSLRIGSYNASNDVVSVASKDTVQW